MEIVLARHGKPRLDRGAWISPLQLPDWLRAFNATDVVNDDVSLLTLKRAAQSEFIVCSSLLRCVQSARILAPSRDIHIDEIFREAELPHALWRFPRLPVSTWVILFRIAWFCGYSVNSESLSLATIRARGAAEKLIDLARQHQSVFAMGHGIMTVLIAKQLVLRGWTGPRRPTNKYWQYCVYQSPN